MEPREDGMREAEGAAAGRRGCGQPRLVLLGGSDGMGLLKLQLADGQTITVAINGRHIRVLLALQDALEAEQDLAAGERGWLNDELIAEAYTRGDRLALPPEPATVSGYRAQINHRIRQATPAGQDAPKLFRWERCVGVRLVDKLDIVDLPQRRKSRLQGGS